ncbi:MAG: hypothetical protein K9H16_11765 [Bacteroidales bacterium]|nr:hypothetical protein [Bacteroidales bacterium]
MKKSVILSLFLILSISFLSAQNSSMVFDKNQDQFVFGQIFADFKYNFNKEIKPVAAFRFNQGIIGYYHKISDKVSGKIMLDVTRTTNFTSITDSLGRPVSFDYFEGSKYTAYLKMAEIKWDVTNYFTLRFGQLLNTQYLTFQDQFWGFRYVDVTMQEKFRLGMPADFGAQVDLKLKDKLLYQFSVVNGEGPFRHQDEDGKFLFAQNIQYYPVPGLTVKLYADFAPAPDTGLMEGDKSIISIFAGYQKPKYRLGGEYSQMNHYQYAYDKNLEAWSVFCSVLLINKLTLLLRYDHLNISHAGVFEKIDYYIGGLQYEPVEKFATSINFRYFSPDELPMILASFGLKF